MAATPAFTHPPIDVSRIFWCRCLQRHSLFAPPVSEIFPIKVIAISDDSEQFLFKRRKKGGGSPNFFSRHFSSFFTLKSAHTLGQTLLGEK
jgi:hypothetical protein